MPAPPIPSRLQGSTSMPRKKRKERKTDCSLEEFAAAARLEVQGREDNEFVKYRDIAGRWPMPSEETWMQWGITSPSAQATQGGFWAAARGWRAGELRNALDELHGEVGSTGQRGSGAVDLGCWEGGFRIPTSPASGGAGQTWWLKP